MDERNGNMEQQMNGVSVKEKEESNPESGHFENVEVEEKKNEVFRKFLALNVWKDDLQAENVQVMQLFHVSPSLPPNSSSAVPLLSAKRSGNSAVLSEECQLAVTTTRIRLTVDSCRLMTAPMETYCDSLADALKLMGQTPAGGVGIEQFQWVSMFSFELLSCEGGMFHPKTEFSEDEATLDILPSLLCLSLNPLLHEIPSLAVSLGQVERVLQLRRHRFEAHSLRRQLLLAAREGHVEDPPEIGESSVRTSQKKRTITEHLGQKDLLERKTKNFGTCLQKEVLLSESKVNVDSILQNPEEVNREFQKELSRLLNRHLNSNGWVGSGEVREGEHCTGDSDDSLTQKTVDDEEIPK